MLKVVSLIIRDKKSPLQLKGDFKIITFQYQGKFSVKQPLAYRSLPCELLTTQEQWPEAAPARDRRGCQEQEEDSGCCCRCTYICVHQSVPSFSMIAAYITTPDPVACGLPQAQYGLYTETQQQTNTVALTSVIQRQCHLNTAIPSIRYKHCWTLSVSEQCHLQSSIAHYLALKVSSNTAKCRTTQKISVLHSALDALAILLQVANIQSYNPFLNHISCTYHTHTQAVQEPPVWIVFWGLVRSG